ncbi:MAG TPA: TonB-dependent receptor [Bryobacteraceae bacterium]|nr:TonB-dependent receptor [Bryobacteraceae bacterium]
MPNRAADTRGDRKSSCSSGLAAACRFAALAFIFLTFTLTSFAQTTSARLEGSVQDQTGAVVPGAKIVVMNVKTQIKTEATSNTSGYFVVNALQPGTYSLTVEATGFRKYALNDISLDVGASINEIVKLEVGQTSESISVEANTVAVQTSDSQVSRDVTMKDIDTLPQLARTPIIIAAYQPGVSYGGAGSQGDATFSRVNGQRSGSNNTTLDGIDVNDAVVPRLGLSLTANNTDSVGEFRIITEGGKAEYGRNAGGQIEMITRSGTNDFHGNAFDYLRNTDLNANDFFNNTVGAPRPILIQNEFGGSFGGPIKHNKLFIFGNYQGRRTHSTISRVRTVPTATALQGLFLYNPTNGGPTQTVNLKTIDPLHLGIDPAVSKLLALFPAVNDNTVGDGLNSAGYRFNNPNNSLEDQFTIKSDYNLSQNNHIFFRESWERNSSIDSLNNADAPFPGQVQGTQGGHRWGVSGGWDWVAKPSLVNEFRYGHQSATTDFNRPERLPDIMYGFNSFTNPISTTFAQGRNSPVDEYIDNLTWVKGSHTFKGGVNTRYIDQYGFNDANIYPTVSFATTNGNAPPSSVTPPNISAADLTRYQSFYNDLLGRVSQVSQTFYTNLKTFQDPGTPVVRNYLFHDWGVFFQDDWKIRRNLTVNIGLRWEYFGVPTERDNLQGTLSNISTLSPLSPANNLSVTSSNAWYNKDLNNFAPRFGFSWDPKGDGKMAIRGNYGIFFDRAVGATTSLVDSNTPGFADTSGNTLPNSNGGDFRATTPGLPLPQHAAAPLVSPPDTRVANIVIFNPNLATGYVHEYGLTIQRELFRNMILDVGYLGSRGVKLFLDRDLNQPQVYSSGFLSAFQQLQAFCGTTTGTTCTGPAPSASNPLVKIYGSASGAVAGVGGLTTVQQGLLGTAANNVDRNTATVAKYAQAGLNDFFLRPFPQFNQVIYGTNDGRAYYDSMQVSLRRNAGDLKYSFNFTWSKNISVDNISTDGNGFTQPLDNYNLLLTKSLSGADHPFNYNWTTIYALPWGHGKRFGTSIPRWLDSLSGGWEIGLLGLWQSGNPFSISSGRVTGPSTSLTQINYSGDRSIGAVRTTGNGVFFFTPDQISALTNVANEPAAGFVGSSGLNTLRGPHFFDMDASLVKRFKITERQALTFRAEAYNMFNNVNFATPATAQLNITSTTFGKISTDYNGARTMQCALRYDF